jgi:N-acetylmuramoyl-L-alanine amidase
VATIVLDAGHGGNESCGGATPNRAVGPRGTLEKNVVLALARQTREALTGLGHRVLLTRDADVNLGLDERAAVATRARADVLLSLHCNQHQDPSVQAAQTWMHTDAGPASRRLASTVHAELVRATGHPDGGIWRANLPLLDPAGQPAKTAACLCEVGYLSDPAEELRLGRGDYLHHLANRLARGIDAGLAAQDDKGAEGRVVHHRVDRSLDVWHEVPLVPQVTGMSCWAAAAAMIIGWRDCIDIDPEELARASGRWKEYRDGLVPEDVETLASAWELEIEREASLVCEDLHRLLAENGPLWMGEASPGLHVVVVAGLYGDGTLDGTWARIADPWPVGRGERYVLSLRELKHSRAVAADLTGGQALILHAGGRGQRSRASSSQWQHREEMEMVTR